MDLKTTTFDIDLKITDSPENKEVMQFSNNQSVLDFLIPKALTFSTLKITWSIYGSDVHGTYIVGLNSSYVSDDYYNVVFGITRAMATHSGTLRVSLVLTTIANSAVTSVEYSEPLLLTVTRSAALDDNSINDVDVADYLQQEITIIQAATGLGEVTIDTTPVLNSENLCTSGGIYTALLTKQNTLTFDSAPTSSSTNPVTSAGIKAALDNKMNVGSSGYAGVVTGSNIVTSGTSATFAFAITDTTGATKYRIDYYFKNSGSASVILKLYYTSSEYHSYTIAAGASFQIHFASNSSSYYWWVPGNDVPGSPETVGTYNRPYQWGVESASSLIFGACYLGMTT
jgi:hypothetical protein